uniref:Uncharacterized protein n=1 Tax=Panagrolaimus davidi TaxID=227884 RepID=A0A914P313_9BILA
MKNTRKACPTPPRTSRVTRKAAIEREPKPAETIKECTRQSPPRTPSVTRKAAIERKPKPAETIKECTSSTPPRTPSVTRKAAVVREPKPAETVKKCNDMLFNNLMTYLEGKILQYFQIMNEIQKEVYKEYTTEENFKFYRFVNMNVHVKSCNLLATKWARTDFKELYQKAFDFYLQKVYPAASTFSVKYQEKIAEYGRILTGIAFVNGDYYLGLTCAVTVLELLPHDTYIFVMVSKWSCQLREFDILDKYYNLAKKHSSEIEVIRSVCRLYSEFFKITNIEKQLEIVDKLIGIKTELKSSSEKTFFGYHALFLIFNLLGHASKLPMMDTEKYGDMMSHFSDEQHCALVIASCRYKEFKLLYDKPPFIYDYEKLPDSQFFLKCVMTIPDYCDSEIQYAKISLENGCVHECEGHLVSALYYGTLLSAPFRVLQPLNALYYIKFRTINDKEKLKGLGAMIALLLGKLSDAKNSVQPYSRFRAVLINDTYTFKAPSDSESVLNKTMVTYISTIPEHLPECGCFLCYETATNGSLYSEIQYSNILIDGFTIQSYNDFKSNVYYYGFRRYKKRKDVLLQIAALKDQNEKEKKMAPLSLLKYICEASTHCLLANKNISEDSKEKMCKNIIGCTAYYYLDLRYYYLLARQLQRKTYSLDAYFWLKNDKEISLESNIELDFMFESLNAFVISKTEQQRPTPPKSPSREALAKQANFYKSQGKKVLGLGGMTDEERNEFNQARIDFKVFQHLLFSEWRRRICLYLGSYLAEEFPWYSAWYFHESRAISLRQHI